MNFAHPHRNVRWAQVLLAALAMGAIAAGCSLFKRAGAAGSSDVVFPRLDTAREQLTYAQQFDQRTLVGRTTPNRDGRLRQILAGYQMVVDHFPDDQIYTPIAMACIGNCYFRLGDYSRTIRIFNQIKEKYPNYPFVHAEAEWKIGQSLELLGKTREAKQYYKRCIDTFGHSRNLEIQAFVALCKQYYLEVAVPRRPRRK